LTASYGQPTLLLKGSQGQPPSRGSSTQNVMRRTRSEAAQRVSDSIATDVVINNFGPIQDSGFRRLTSSHRQRAQPSVHRIPAPARLGIDPLQSREPVQQPVEDDLGLHQRQARADAHVRAGAERQQAAGAARDVEAIGLRMARRIAVG